MRILSWNVNGLRAAAGKGYLDWLKRCRGDLVFLQEIKAREEQLPDDVRAPHGWHATFNPAVRPGYSGVALYAKQKPDEVTTGIGVERFDAEGRVITARVGRLAVLGVYFPNGGNEKLRVPFKLEFYEALRAHLDALRADGQQPIVVGDFNTAHHDIDLARPKENRDTSGFLPEERAVLDQWCSTGWVDSFRTLHPTAAEHYSWWTFRAGARARNIGWRIDQCWLDQALLPRLAKATIHPTVTGSDHCPVGVELAE